MAVLLVCSIVAMGLLAVIRCCYCCCCCRTDKADYLDVCAAGSGIKIAKASFSWILVSVLLLLLQVAKLLTSTLPHTHGGNVVRTC